MTSLQMITYRDALQRAAAELTARRDELAVSQETDPIDAALAQSERDREARVRTLDARKARAIQAALLRLRTGCYGACEECDQDISPARLAAVPWARLCRMCAEVEEHQDAPHAEMMA